MYLENKDLTIMKDHDLLIHFSLVVQKEREATVTVICYLSEIERRKLYLEEAYPSLFSFVTQKFHYSEGAAYRRIQASKVSQLYAEVLGLLSNGKVSLMTLSLIEPHLTKENANGWVEKIIGKSKREVEFMLSEFSLKKESHRDIIRRLPVFRALERQEKLPAPLKVPGSSSCLPLPSSGPESAQNHTFTGGNRGEDLGFTGETSALHPLPSIPKEGTSVRKIKIEFVAKEEMAKKIERAKEILRHKFPEGKIEDIFNQALEDMLEMRDPERKIGQAKKKGGGCEVVKKAEGEEEKKEESHLSFL